jgi:asparagine synthase (glutamine-hydrolysing)
MCGILGYSPADPGDVFLRARDALAHRGPDASGSLVREGVTFGHTRLSIIDLKGGAQPMTTPDGRLAITYNGEIYNFLKLRDLLESAGHCFRTQSDTEVLLHAYREWGRDCVTRLRGMFAFAIVDFQTRKIFLARDHLGIKPLVYSFAGNRFSFASEIQALRAMPWVEDALEPDPQGIYECLRFGYSCAPCSAYRQIRKLPPAHYMEIDVDHAGRQVMPVRYWRLEHNPDESLSAEECEEMVDMALRDSVKSHLVADVPFGAFLSGGIDSSLVVSYMSEILEEPVRTFCIGFKESKFDERPYAREVAKKLGTHHYEEVVKGHAIDLLPKLIKHYGEPFGDSSAIPTWHVSRLAREHVPMVLSGDGGDEFFAGYQSYSKWLGWMNNVRKKHPSRQRTAWKNRARVALSWLMPRRYAPDPPFPRPTLPDWMNIHSVFWSQHIEPLLQPEFAREVDFEPEAMRNAFAAVNGHPDVTLARSVDINGYLPNDILTKVDIASMMHGLESRTPLTDVRIAELSGRIPWHRLIEEGGRDFGWTGKLPLRRILSRKFSPEFINRPKQGFSIPILEWLHDDSKESRAIHERLRAPHSRLTKWLRPDGIRQVLDRRHGSQTWHLLVLVEWLEQNRF